jgi:hypothetical protein
MYEEAFFHELINEDFSAYSALSAFRIFLVAANRSRWEYYSSNSLSEMSTFTRIDVYSIILVIE